MMHGQAHGLWRHADFLKLWIGETISVFGSSITGLALPITAATLLQATPAQMGLLSAAQTAPFLLIGLFAGVWVDRLRRRPILIGADIGRALLLGVIPLLWLFKQLRIEYLYGIEFGIGVLTVFFDVAYQSYVPVLVTREQLVDGNGKLEISRSAAQIAGPGLAGVLIQVFTAPIAIIMDAVSFAASALFLGVIRTPEPAPYAPATQRRNLWREIGEGLTLVVRNPILRPIAACTATTNICTSLWGAVFVLYLTRDLQLGPALLGAIFAIGAPGALLGALLAGRVAKRFGVGPTIVGSAFIGGLGGLLIPLASGPVPVAAALLIAAEFLIGFAFVIYNVTQVSLRQVITPDRLLGRMTATMRFLVWGTLPIGALIGGVLGDALGVRQTLMIGGGGMALAFVWVLCSPVRSLYAQPRPLDDPESVESSHLAAQ